MCNEIKPTHDIWEHDLKPFNEVDNLYREDKQENNNTHSRCDMCNKATYRHTATLSSTVRSH